jgi:S1-C subfamily serine protease
MSLRAQPTPATPVLASPTVYVAIGDEGHGSGVYIGKGLVLTAGHVASNDEPLKVVANGTNYAAKVLWVNKEHDLALLEIPTDAPIKAAKLACREPIVGERIFSEGSPLNVGYIRVPGWVAGTTRLWNENTVTPLIAPVLWGMSGGPVYDEAGDILGINDMVTLGPVYGMGGQIGVSAEDIGWMVPSSVACHLMGRG